MDLKKLILLGMGTLFLLVILPNINAFGNQLHYNTTFLITQDKDCKTQDCPLIQKIIQENWDACLTGLEYPDVSIKYYWTNFKVYKGLHSYTTVDEMLRIANNDRQRAFAYCWKIHLAQDGISHNYNVPAAIRTTKLPNFIIHPVQELKIDGHYYNIVASRLMEKHSEFDAFVQQATGRDWSSEAEWFNTIIGGNKFYTEGFAPDSTTWIGKFEKVLYKLTTYVVSEKTSIDYVRLAEDETRRVLRGETSNSDPSGESALASSDSQTSLWLYLGSFLIIGIIFYVSWRKRIIGW
jgi:hypothetical protein